MDFNEFAQRTEQLKNKLYRTAYLYTRQLQTAEDAVSEAVYRGLKALPRLKEPEYFETWLVRILINVCKNQARRNKKELLLPQYTQETMDALAAAGTSLQDNPFDRLALKDAVFSLPAPYKDIIILRFIDGYTLEETAAILRLPRGTIATRQRKALAILRLELGEEVSYESK